MEFICVKRNVCGNDLGILFQCKKFKLITLNMLKIKLSNTNDCIFHGNSFGAQMRRRQKKQKKTKITRWRRRNKRNSLMNKTREKTTLRSCVVVVFYYYSSLNPQTFFFHCTECQVCFQSVIYSFSFTFFLFLAIQISIFFLSLTRDIAMNHIISTNISTFRSWCYNNALNNAILIVCDSIFFFYFHSFLLNKWANVFVLYR